MNLVMAAFWAVIAAGAFALAWLEPDLRFVRIGGTGLNIGWLALVFCAYNIVRWLSGRVLAQQRRIIADRAEHRYRPRPGAAQEAEHNPAFDFSDRPPDDGIRPPPR